MKSTLGLEKGDMFIDQLGGVVEYFEDRESFLARDDNCKRCCMGIGTGKRMMCDMARKPIDAGPECKSFGFFKEVSGG